MNAGTELITARNSQKAINSLGLAISNPKLAGPEITETIGPGGVAQMKIDRSFSSQGFQTLLKASTSAGHASGIQDILTKVGGIMGELDGVSSLSRKMNDMMDAIHITTIDATSREKAVTAIGGFFAQADADKASMQDLDHECDNRIQNVIASVNAALRQIFQSNLSLSADESLRNPGRSSAELNAAELAKYMKLTHTVSGGGRLLLSGHMGIGMNFVSDSTFAQFSYNANTDKLTYSFHSSQGQISPDVAVEVMDGDTFKLNCGGMVEGLFKVKSELLPQVIKDMDKGVDSVAETLNVFHNEGSGFPPSLSRTSARTVLGTETLSGSGTVEFYPVGADGRPVASLNARSPILPIKVDVSQQQDVNSLVAAINKESTCLTEAGAAIGNNVDGQAGRFLIDQAALQADVTNGQASIRMRLESGGFANAKLRIRELAVSDGVNPNALIVPQAAPTDWTSVASGDIVKTPLINFAVPAPTQQTLRVSMVVEVVGEDGTFSTENISYLLDSGAGNTMTNYTGANYHQAEAVFNGAGLTAPSATNAAIAQPKSGAAPVRASIVDSKFVLGGRVAIVGNAKFGSQGFSRFLGLQDIVSKDSNGSWKVDSDVVNDPNLLALAKPTKQPAVNVTTLPGVNSAAAELSFVAGVPGNTDTITINGQEFRFMNVPVNANDVQIAPAGPQQAQNTVLNLIALINSGSFPNVSDLVTVAVNGGDARIMDVTAKNAGTKGNAIAIARAGAGAHVWNNTANPGGGAVFLDNGTDAAGNGTRSATSFAFEVIANNNANALTIFNPLTLSDGTVITMKNALLRQQLIVSKLIETHEMNRKEAEEVQFQAEESFTSSRKLDEHEALLMIAMRVKFVSMLYEIIRLKQKADSMMLDGA